jgi:excisionase family DNA binding protein
MTDQLATTPSAPPQLLLTPRQAAQALGIGRSQLYELMGKGEIESVRIGASRRIPVDALDHYVMGLRGRVELVPRPHE